MTVEQVCGILVSNHNDHFGKPKRLTQGNLGAQSYASAYLFGGQANYRGSCKTF